MASVAESSVASVPLPLLAHLRDNLLQERGDAPQPEANSETNTGGAATSASVVNHVLAVNNDITPSVPESAEAYRTPKSSPKGPPRLSNSKSAPAAAMEAMVSQSPSQEAFRAMTRASSFHVDPAEATQRMDSQVYRDYEESKANPSTTPVRKTMIRMEISPDGKINTVETNTTDKTQRTYVEGDTGYIDVVQALGETSPTPMSTSSNMDDLLTSPQTTVHHASVPTKAHFPETPALAGRKRDSSGEIRTSETTARTMPAFSQLFAGGAKGALLTDTQLFNQTQAPSSPIPDGPRSDPILTRPSPNMHNQFNMSSPTLTMSSPVATTHPRRPTSAGEPRGHYTSMMESQERRAARMRQELGLQPLIGGEDLDGEDDEIDNERRRFESKRMQRIVGDQALQKMTKFRSIPRPRSRPLSSPGQAESITRPIIDLTTPGTMKKGERDEFDISEDGDVTDEDVAMNEDEELAGGEPSDDGYDELGQALLRSQNNDEVEDEERTLLEDRDDREGMSNDDGANEEALAHLSSPREADQTADPRTVRTQSATQHSAVADSQPLPQREGLSLQEQQTYQPSSVSYFVPGSQYTGKTSQHATQTAAKIPDSTSRPQMSPAIQEQNEPVPSSPPFVATDSADLDTSAEASAARQQLLADFQQDRESRNIDEREIPDSDLPGQESRQNMSSRAGVSHEADGGESKDIAPFSTAQTHQSPKKKGWHVSTQELNPSQHSNVSQSPRTAAGVRHFSEIAADQSPLKGSGQTDVDVDAVMSDFMTAEDKQYLDATSSPPVERASKRLRLARPELTRISSSAIQDRPSALSAKKANPDTAVETSATIVPEQPAIVSTTPDALQDSPNKANELPQAPPTLQDEEVDSTPESVRLREKAGAKAVSQLITYRSAKPSKPSKLEGPVKGKKINRKKSSNTTGKNEQPRPQALQKAVTNPEESEINPARRSPQTDEAALPRDNDDADVNNEPCVEEVGSAEGAPNRVFALFKGQYNNFYPGTWLGLAADGTYRIKFDDTTVTTMEAHHVRSLQLSVGDHVKVDIPSMRTKTWIIHNFDSPAQSDAERQLGTDVYGRNKVKVQPKSTRTSVPGADAKAKDGDEIIEVAISNIYLTHTMWPHFKDRVFTPPATVAARVGTPTVGVQTPNSETPTSRSRRTVIPTAKAVAERGSNLQEVAVAPTSTPTSTGMFSGMAFAISYGSSEDEKSEVTRMLQRNGGIILETGFDELFNLPSLDESAPTSPSKKSARKADNSDHEDEGLLLKPEYEGLGFVALIADRHSRRAKYIQALALGLPTLSGRWVSDSLNIAKNQTGNAPLSWAKYLLPAGESTYLGGAIRSRVMSIYNAEQARLSDTINSRDNLLNGDGVLIVAPRKGKGGWERRKAYAFLTIALGAGRVKRVSDLHEAKALVSEEFVKWKWIYVDGAVTEASGSVFGKASASSKKRKRGEESKKDDANIMSVENAGVRIVNDEFVVQSLILGALLDTEDR